MISIKRLREYSRPELIDIAVLYDRYVRKYRGSYNSKVEYRIGISAFFYVRYLFASVDSLNEVIKKSPELEDIIVIKLNSLSDAQLYDFLAEFDRYLINMDSQTNSDRVPVCMDEFLDNDYKDYKAELLCSRFKSQIEEYETALLLEGAAAMRDKNKELLDIVKCFYEAFCSYDYNEEALDAVASLARENKLISAILDWSMYKNVDLYIAVVANTLGIFFDEFCLSIIDINGTNP